MLKLVMSWFVNSKPHTNSIPEIIIWISIPLEACLKFKWICYQHDVSVFTYYLFLSFFPVVHKLSEECVWYFPLQVESIKIISPLCFIKLLLFLFHKFFLVSCSWILSCISLIFVLLFLAVKFSLFHTFVVYQWIEYKSISLFING